MAAARKRRKNVAHARRRIGVGRWFHGSVGMSRACADDLGVLLMRRVYITLLVAPLQVLRWVTLHQAAQEEAAARKFEVR